MDERLFTATKQAFEHRRTYPGYPEIRLVLPLDFDTHGPIDIPEGPWQTNKEKRDEVLPTPQATAAFAAAGYAVDTLGRPLHPWLKNMSTNPAIGVVTGKGKYYNWGPNYAADPIVITNETRPQVLLIQRSDTKRWALPGGFVDPGEIDTQTTALRELCEETGLTIDAQGTLIYEGVVADLRTTAHAWVETSAYVFHVNTALPIEAGDDAINAEWRYIDTLEGTLYGSHFELIQMAVEQLNATD